MIEISPAILINDVPKLTELFNGYLALPAAQIDIDICEDKFVHNQTVPTAEVLQAISQLETDKIVGYHLMVAHPEADVKAILEADLKHKHMIYVHAESNYKFLLNQKFGLSQFGLTVMAETKLPNMEIISEFPEIQLMTIETGKQGNPFLPEVVEKVTELAMLGYTGRISIDGGVNLTSAEEIKYWEIDRVSVGSFFQKSKDAQLAYMKLQLALNLKEQMFDV